MHVAPHELATVAILFVTAVVAVVGLMAVYDYPEATPLQLLAAVVVSIVVCIIAFAASMEVLIS